MTTLIPIERSLEVITLQNAAWVLTADAGGGRLLRCGLAPLGRCHVEEVDVVQCNSNLHEHGRPSPLSAKNGNTYASPGHENEEALHRAARQVQEWLAQKAREHRIERLTLFAPPRFLGELRKLVPAKANPTVDLSEGDLTAFDTQVLSRHPAILQLVGPRL